MNRLLLTAACLLPLVTSCAAEMGGPEDETSSLEQGVIRTCDSVPLTDWRGQELFRGFRNPTVILTAGDTRDAFYAWGVSNGERVVWVMRATTRDYGSFMAQVHREWAEMEAAGANFSYGLSGSIKKGFPIPPPPPIGFPPEMVARVLHGADMGLAGTNHMFNNFPGGGSPAYGE